MKRLLVSAVLLVAGALHAEDVAVFGEDDFVVLGPAAGAAAAKRDSREAAFFERWAADRAHAAPFEASTGLVSPPSWGRAVGPETRGTLSFHRSFPGGFACHLTLENLLPNHRYILTLNGNPERAGNDLLRTPVPSNERERYYDFLIVTTDGRGSYEAGLGVFLKPGAYDVRCYVKDTDDFKIVLYRDYFPFTVE